MDWLLENKQWVFSGVGVAIGGLVLTWLMRRSGSRADPEPHTALVTSVKAPIENRPAISNQNIVSIDVGPGLSSSSPSTPPHRDLDTLKAKTHILFVDDDTKFKVVDILMQCGWIHTKKMRDAKSLDDDRIRQAHVLFIDIHGVGIRLGFHDEGLGLAIAVKDKYPEKRVVIYSAEPQGDRFHEGLRRADDVIFKNADPYQFQQATERLSEDYFASR